MLSSVCPVASLDTHHCTKQRGTNCRVQANEVEIEGFVTSIA